MGARAAHPVSGAILKKFRQQAPKMGLKLRFAALPFVNEQMVGQKEELIPV